MQNHHLTSVSTSPKKSAQQFFFTLGPISGKYDMNNNNDGRGNMLTVKLMLFLCVAFHFIIIPIWMWSLGLH